MDDYRSAGARHHKSTSENYIDEMERYQAMNEKRMGADSIGRSPVVASAQVRKKRSNRSAIVSPEGRVFKKP